jgi:uncharacterized membrane protein
VDSFLYAFAWWAGIFVVGQIAFLAIRPYFGSLIDEGYAIAKVLGIVGLTYILWLLGSLHLLPFTQISVIGVVLVAAIAMKWRVYRLQQNWIPSKWAMISEGLFSVALASWSVVRAFNPRAEGVEKLMDVGILNGLLRGHYFPPQDIWYAGSSVNYYYYGQLMVATLAKLTHVPASYASNLGIIGTFALVVAVTFSLVMTLSRLPLAAGLSAFLLALSSNIDPAVVQLRGDLAQRFTWYAHLDPDAITKAKAYIFFSATRLDPYTINEFPLYSFFVADMHAHTLGLPLTLTLITLLYVIFQSKQIIWPVVGLLALVLGATGPTNAFDLAMYAGLTAIVITVRSVFEGGEQRHRLKEAILLLGGVLAGAIVLYLPFYVSFHAPVGGVGIDLFKTSLPFILTNFGILLYFSLPLLLVGAIKLGATAEGQRSVTVKQLYSRLTPAQWFALILLLFGALLILAPEIGYLKDIYSYRNPPYARANTIFKVYFQAWAVLAIVAGCGLGALTAFRDKKIFVTLFMVGAGVMVALSTIGIWSAIQTQQGHKITTLDGYNYLVTEAPDQLALISWMNQHVVGQPTILEAAGESYTQRSRVSSYTGLPTVIGWASHEWGWRYSNTAWDLISARMGEVQQMYTTTDPTFLKQELQKWHIHYVIISPVETGQYPGMASSTIQGVCGSPAFSRGDYALYACSVGN